MGESSNLPRLAWRLLLALAAAKVGVHVSTLGGYGFHRDELYYLACGRHLAWGFVDHAPLTPFLARAVELVAGPSIQALRLVAALAGGAIVFLAGALARELGGRAWAQGLSALLVLVAPVFLLTNNLFQTVTFDQLVWVGVCWTLLRIYRTGNRPLWLAVGLLMGIGLLTKYTILLFASGIGVGLVLTRERLHLRSPYPWFGAALAMLIALPNLVWQVDHGWPTLEFIVNNGDRAAADFPPPLFLLLQLIFIGLVSVPVFGAGLTYLLRAPETERFRALGWAAVVVLTLLAVRGGKPYYPAPIFPVVFAAGAVWLEGRAERRSWHRLNWVVPLVLLIGNLPTLWITLPIVPERLFAAHQDAWPHPEFREMFGWQELTDQVGEVLAGLPAAERQRAGILTDSYGEASALALFGETTGLPRPTSGHDSFFFWGPPESDVVIAVTASQAHLERLFEAVREVRPVTNALGIRNEAAAKSIYVCRRPRRPWPEIWNELRSFI